MSLSAPTFNQIKAQVSAIRQKTRQDVRTVGIQTSGGWTEATQLSDGDEVYSIQQCESPLAMRLAMRQRTSEITIQVLLTSLNEEALGTDILLRLAKQTLFKVDRWNIVKSLFDASKIDPRLIKHSCIADYLMEYVPNKGYAPAIGGFLDAETVWEILLRECLGLVSDRLDLLSLLEWSTSIDNVQCYQQAPSTFKEALIDWLNQTIGPIAVSIISCCNVLDSPSDALVVGLVLEVLFHPEVSGPAIDRAIGKLEATYLSQNQYSQALHRGMANLWSNSALEILRLKIVDQQQKYQLIERSDTLLQSLGVESFAYYSDSSIIGYHQRLTQFSETILSLIKKPGYLSLQQIDKSFSFLEQHEISMQPTEHHCKEQCKMILRLTRWLVSQHIQPPMEPKSLDEAILSELQQGGFVDWSRSKLHQSNNHRNLSDAIQLLLKSVTHIREQQAQKFAHLLQGWTELGGQNKIFIPVEEILEKIVAPLSSSSRVLIIVMDGMGTAACSELISNITRDNSWTRIVPESYPASLMAGLAAIPSITKVSRTSLLCGKLKIGTKSDEVREFKNHPQLVQSCLTEFPPVLFHKDALRNNDNQSKSVRELISSLQHKVIGVVINAIDDNLKQGDQINVTWNTDSIPILSTLLIEAKQSNRIVVLLSDHGHIMEYNTVYHSKLSSGHDGGERWHSDYDNLTEGELTLKGNRVLLPATHKIVVPWSERIRYSKTANGHHGGISPQEMVIPIAILHHSTPPKTWKEASVDYPIWWNTSLTELSDSDESSIIKENLQSTYGPLFGAISSENKSTISSLVDSLLDSSIYHIQQGKLGRSSLENEIVRNVLVNIEKNNFSIHLVTLAKLVNFSSKRMQSCLLKLQRILNIDGYQILIYDQISMQISLSKKLLFEQFNL